MHLMAKGFESLNQFSGGAGGIESIEIVVTQIPVGCIGLQHLERDGQYFMAGSNDSLRPSAPGFNAVKEGAQVSFLAM